MKDITKNEAFQNKMKATLYKCSKNHNTKLLSMINKLKK
ncbi:Uncharacterised protein [Elizabethkingia miricola]|nr:Uncharacterised protein [Elizabethkingia anophelis]SPW34286.1 Uncharacterised protein [Elizabethkingia miricola]DAT28647.1 MAG TPA: hypothetical protein [Caudoviricetes sp.]